METPVNVVSADPLDEALDHFTDPRSYGRRHLTRDQKVISGCGDPRDEDDDDVKTITQIMGAGVGKAVNRSLGNYAARRQFVPIEASIAAEAVEVQETEVITVHKGCLFVVAIVPIHRRIEQPDAFTDESVDKWARIHQLSGEVKAYRARIRSAAGKQGDYIEKHGGPELVYSVLDGAYPEHPNLREMKGENQAGIYTVNHHPHVSLDRHRTHRDKKIAIQSYHTSLRMNLDQIHGNHHLSKREKAARSVALLFTEAAVRSVIRDKHEGINCIEVFPGKKGLEFEQFAA